MDTQSQKNAKRTNTALATAQELDRRGDAPRALAAFKTAHAAGQLRSESARQFVAALAISLGDHTFARQLSGQPRARHRVSAWWAALGVALLLAVGAAASRAPQVICTVPVLSAFCAPETFLVQVRVTDEITGAAIADAAVSLEVGGRAPYRTLTDSEGVAVFKVAGEFDNRPGRVTVDAAGHQSRNINITVQTGSFPLSVQLQSIP